MELPEPARVVRNGLGDPESGAAHIRTSNISSNFENFRDMITCSRLTPRLYKAMNDDCQGSLAAG